MTTMLGNASNAARGRRSRADGRRWRRAMVPRGWLEVQDCGEWSAVPPGSTTIPADVRCAYLRRPPTEDEEEG